MSSHPRSPSDGIGVALYTRNGVPSSSDAKNASMSSSNGSAGSTIGRSGTAMFRNGNGQWLSKATKSSVRRVGLPALVPMASTRSAYASMYSRSNVSLRGVDGPHPSGSRSVIVRVRGTSGAACPCMLVYGGYASVGIGMNTLAKDALEMTEPVEARLAVVRAHAARANAAERQVRRRDVIERRVHAGAPAARLVEDASLHVGGP